MKKEQKFEDALRELEDVVRKLEAGDGTLEEMIALYEKGTSLVVVCTKRLDAYEAKIEKLSETEARTDDV